MSFKHSGFYSPSNNEILETIQMVRMEHLDIRTVTMGINLRDCSHPDIEVFNENIYEKITTRAKDLVRTTNEIQCLYGIPIINKRISVTPIAIAAGLTISYPLQRLWMRLQKKHR